MILQYPLQHLPVVSSSQQYRVAHAQLQPCDSNLSPSGRHVVGEEDGSKLVAVPSVVEDSVGVIDILPIAKGNTGELDGLSVKKEVVVDD